MPEIRIQEKITARTSGFNRVMAMQLFTSRAAFELRSLHPVVETLRFCLICSWGQHLNARITGSGAELRPVASLGARLHKRIKFPWSVLLERCADFFHISNLYFFHHLLEWCLGRMMRGHCRLDTSIHEPVQESSFLWAWATSRSKLGIGRP